MPNLRRIGVPKLLKTVHGRPHATEQDHEVEYNDSTITKGHTQRAASTFSRGSTSLTEEQIYAEPLSSSDDDEPSHSAPTFQLPTAVSAEQSPGSTGSKRSTRSGFPSDSTAGDDDDQPIFSSQGSQIKRTKKGAAPGPRFVNLHAPPRRPQTYGSAARRPVQQKAKSSKFRTPPKSAALAEKTQKPKTPKPVFMQAPDVLDNEDMFHFVGSDFHNDDKENEAVFRMSAIGGEEVAKLSPASSSLSSLPHNPEPATSAIQGNTQSQHDVEDLRIICTICNEPVSILLKQQFEDKFSKIEPLTFKWQRRFCRHHRAHDAGIEWNDRGYPDIDWASLECRMCRCHSHLRDVISGAKDSVHREELSKRIKRGLDKSTGQIWTAKHARQGAGTAVGYYGPRGERLMTEHIIAHLSDPLREQASKDRLVAAAGMAGGVSGFVQAVLVPEMAEHLIAQDLEISVEQAREVVKESAEMGDLLWPEMDERIGEGLEDSS